MSNANPLSRLPAPLQQPWFNPWAFEHPEKMRAYHDAQRWWNFCTVWRSIGECHAIRIGWYRKWPHFAMPAAPVPSWEPHAVVYTEHGIRREFEVAVYSKGALVQRYCAGCDDLATFKVSCLGADDTWIGAAVHEPCQSQQLTQYLDRDYPSERERDAR